MNAKSLKVAVLVALVALFASAFNVLAYPAELPSGTPSQAGQPAACQLSSVDLSSMDIPARRADYNLLDRIAPCATADQGANGVIPVSRAQNNRFMQFKDLQAELASGGEKYTPRSSKAMTFAEFKEQQADQRSQ